MTRKPSPGLIAARLADAYPEAACSLNFRNAYELLVATILSAQCTDERVNQVTPALFDRCPTPGHLARMEQGDIEELIRSTGFYHNKAKSLLGAARLMAEDFGGKVPGDMESLLRLPGVARKTANVVLGNAFGKSEGFVVDTHVGRLARRMGFSGESDPAKVEADLMKCFPRDEWVVLGHRLIHHGRLVCTARKPYCVACPIAEFCPKIGV